MCFLKRKLVVLRRGGWAHFCFSNISTYINFSVQCIECMQPGMIHDRNAYPLPFIIMCRNVHNCSLMTRLWSWHIHGLGSQNLRPCCVLAIAHGHIVILREAHDLWKSAHAMYVLISTSCLYTIKMKKKKISIPCSFLKGKGWSYLCKAQMWRRHFQYFQFLYSTCN